MSTTRQYVQVMQGDISTPLVENLVDQNGNAINLIGCTVAFRMVNVWTGAIQINNAAATVISPASAGQVQYQWGTLDLSVPGVYEAWFIVTDGSGNIQHYPCDDSFIINVRPAP